MNDISISGSVETTHKKIKIKSFSDEETVLVYRNSHSAKTENKSKIIGRAKLTIEKNNVIHYKIEFVDTLISQEFLDVYKKHRNNFTFVLSGTEEKNVFVVEGVYPSRRNRK